MQILVLGMHRSGTSVVARFINMMGAYLGPEGSSMGVTPDGPKGLWERHDVKEINNLLLESRGATWDRPARYVLEGPTQSAHQAFSRKCRDLILELDGHRPWAIKDPRLCLLLDNWLPHCELPVVVIVVRSPIEVAHSLLRRNRLPLTYGLSLWQLYMTAALELTASTPRYFVDFRSVRRQPRQELAALYSWLVEMNVRRLEMPCDAEIIAFLKREFVHTIEGHEQSERLSVGQSRLYKNLLQACRSKAIKKSPRDPRSLAEDLLWLDEIRDSALSSLGNLKSHVIYAESIFNGNLLRAVAAERSAEAREREIAIEGLRKRLHDLEGEKAVLEREYVDLREAQNKRLGPEFAGIPEQARQIVAACVTTLPRILRENRKLGELVEARDVQIRSLSERLQKASALAAEQDREQPRLTDSLAEAKSVNSEKIAVLEAALNQKSAEAADLERKLSRSAILLEQKTAEQNALRKQLEPIVPERRELLQADTSLAKFATGMPIAHHGLLSWYDTLLESLKERDREQHRILQQIQKTLEDFDRSRTAKLLKSGRSLLPWLWKTEEPHRFIWNCTERMKRLLGRWPFDSAAQRASLQALNEHVAAIAGRPECVPAASSRTVRSEEPAGRTTITPASRPIIVQMTPAKTRNHFFTELPRALEDRGWDFRYSTDLADMVRYAEERGPDLLFWFHQFEGFYHSAAGGRDEVRRRRLQLVEALTRLRENGAKVVHTWHNPLPHDRTFLQEDLLLYRQLGERLDLVFSLTSKARDWVRSFCPAVPFIAVRHPAYTFVENGISRPEARLALGLPEAGFLYLVFGEMKAYKGLETLAEAWNLLLREEPRRGAGQRLLVIAGAWQDGGAIKKRLTALDDVHVIDRYIDDATASRLLRSSHATILTHREIWVSGAAIASLSAGRPPIVPAESGLLDYVQPGDNGLVYEGGVAESLARTILDFEERGDSAHLERLCEIWAHRNRPEILAAEYGSILADLRAGGLKGDPIGTRRIYL